MPIPLLFNNFQVAPVSRYPQVRTMRDDYDSGTSSVASTDTSDDSNVYGEDDSSTSLPVITSNSSDDSGDSSSGGSSSIDLSTVPWDGVASVLNVVTNALGLTKPASTINKTTIVNPASTVATTIKKYMPYILMIGGAAVVYLIVKKRK